MNITHPEVPKGEIGVWQVIVDSDTTVTLSNITPRLNIFTVAPTRKPLPLIVIYVQRKQPVNPSATLHTSQFGTNQIPA